MALAPELWTHRRGDSWSGGCGAGKASGRRGQGSSGRAVSPDWPGGRRAQGPAGEKAPGPVLGTRGAVRGCEDGADRKGLGGGGPGGAALFQGRRGRGVRGWAGANAGVHRASPLPSRGPGEVAGSPAGPAAARAPGVEGALTRLPPRDGPTGPGHGPGGRLRRGVPGPRPLPGLPT